MEAWYIVRPAMVSVTYTVCAGGMTGVGEVVGVLVGGCMDRNRNVEVELIKHGR